MVDFRFINVTGTCLLMSSLYPQRQKYLLKLLREWTINSDVRKKKSQGKNSNTD